MAYQKYQKTIWVNGETPLNSTHLNNIEDGLEEASQEIIEVKADIDTINTSIEGLEKKNEDLNNSINEIISIEGNSSKVKTMPEGSNIIELSKNTEICPLNSIINLRIYNGVNSPIGDSDNDFYYTIYKMNDGNYTKIVAKDIRSNKMYINTEVNQVWTEWQEINEVNSIYCVADNDNRTINTKPSDYKCCLKLNILKQSESVGLPNSGGFWSHLIGINAWEDNTAMSYELALSGNNLYMRHNQNVLSDSEGYDKWVNWDRFIKQSEYVKLIGENNGSGHNIISYIRYHKEQYGLMRGSFNTGYVTADSDLPNGEKSWRYCINYSFIEGNHFAVEAIRALSNETWRAIVDINQNTFISGWSKVLTENTSITLAKNQGISFISANENNGIKAGNGDGATFDTCNLDLYSWYGIGIVSTCNTINKGVRTLAINARNGEVFTKGDIYVKEDKKVTYCEEIPLQIVNGWTNLNAETEYIKSYAIKEGEFLNVFARVSFGSTQQWSQILKFNCALYQELFPVYDGNGNTVGVCYSSDGGIYIHKITNSADVIIKCRIKIRG